VTEAQKLGIETAVLRSCHIPEIIIEARDKAIPYGIPFLDAALIGILPTDLILIGANTGIGKTALGVEIAKQACLQKKKVLFIALEAEKAEIEMRLEYQLYAKNYLEDKMRDRSLRFDFRAYRYGKLKGKISQYTEPVLKEFTERYISLFTRYKDNEPFTANTLETLLEWAKKNVDMVIVDHLHYFDMNEMGKDSNERLGRLMQRIRDMTLHFRVPVILMAHTRKDHTSFLPSEADFRGSSDISKIATTCIMLAKIPKGYDPSLNQSKTAFLIPKGRAGQIHHVGIVPFSITHSAYLRSYTLGLPNEYHKTIEALPRPTLPYWAKEDPQCLNE